MPVKVDTSELQKLGRALSRAAKNAPKEIKRATNSVARAGGTEAKRAAAKVYSLRQRRIAQDIVVTKGTGSVTISSRGKRPISVLSYGGKQGKRGLQFRILKGGRRTLLRRGFVQKGLPLKRVGKSRYPIEFVYGPSVADMLANQKVQKPLIKNVTGRAVKELRRRLGKLNG